MTDDFAAEPMERGDEIHAACGAAGLGTVASIEPLATLPHSRVARVRLTSGAGCIFKIAGTVDFAASAKREIAVNTDVLTAFPVPVAPKLLGSDRTAECPWMLFEDVSPPFLPIRQVPPRVPEFERLLTVLARTHAQSARLDLPALFNHIEGTRHCAEIAPQVPAVLDAFLATTPRDVYPAAVEELVATIRDNVHTLYTAIRAERPVFLHGDAHHQNALYSETEALLIDWSQATTGPGEIDLCSTMAMNMPRLLGRAREPGAFALYCRTLQEHGVDTSEHDVRERYRLCLLQTVIVAIAFRSIPGIDHHTWSYLFTNAVEAALDLDCRALL